MLQLYWWDHSDGSDDRAKILAFIHHRLGSCVCSSYKYIRKLWVALENNSSNDEEWSYDFAGKKAKCTGLISNGWNFKKSIIDFVQSGNAFGDGMSFLLFSRNGMCMPSSLLTFSYRVNILHSCLCSMSSRATPLKPVISDRAYISLGLLLLFLLIIKRGVPFYLAGH